MRHILLILLASLLPLMAQESDYQSNLLVLTDGRIVAIRGEMEIIGDEVQFMYADGQLMTLPLSKIDLEKTRAKQEELTKKAKEQRDIAVQGEKTVYDEIRQYQAKERKNSPNNQPPAESKRSFEKKEKQKRILQIDSNPIKDLDRQQLEDKAQEFLNQMENVGSSVKWTLLGLLILIAVFALLSFVTRIYLIFHAKHVSGLWMFAMLLATFAPFCFGLLSPILPTESVFLIFLSFFIVAVQIAEPFIYCIYILIHCVGKRLLLLFLYLSPIFFAIAFVVALIVMNFPMAF